MKKNWNGYNLLDLFLILIGIITVTSTSIIFKSPWYIIVNTLLGLLCVFTQAKGKIATQFLGVLYFCFYIAISYRQQYYGEAIVYSFLMLPMYIYGVIHWLKNKDKEDNVVIVRSNLTKKEWLFSAFFFIVMSIFTYLILKMLDTSQLIISTLSVITIIPALYLLVRRCKWNQVAFLVNDFIVPILWIILAVNGELIFIPMCVYHIFQITYDIYGLLEWIKLEKKQKQYQ